MIDQDDRKMKQEEHTDVFVAAARRMYQDIVEIVPAKNQLNIRKTIYKRGDAQHSLSYSLFLSNYVDEWVVGDDQQAFIRNFSREAVEEFLEKKHSRRELHIRYHGEGNKRRWCQVTLESTECEGKALLLVKDDDLPFLHFMKQRFMEQENDFIMGIHANTGHYSVYWGEDMIEESSMHLQSEEYDTMVFANVYACFPPEQTEEIFHRLSLDYVKRQLDRKGEYVTYVMGKRDGQIYHRKYRYIYFDQEKHIILLFMQNVTEVREKELRKNLELQAALNRAEKANMDKNIFLSRVSHDIRTPLNAILGMTELAEKRAEEPEIVRECLHDIMMSSELLMSLFDEMVNMNQLFEKKIMLQETTFSLREMFQSYVNILQGKIREHHHHFLFYTHEIYHDTVKGDRKRIGEIFMNLATNAIKYTPDGGELLFECRELNQREDGKVLFQLRMKDNGVGISPQFQKEMFDLFTREIGERTCHIAGTGLGLSIVKEFVECMQGTIRVNSQPGQGTEFIICLPLELVREEKKSGQPGTVGTFDKETSGQQSSRPSTIETFF